MPKYVVRYEDGTYADTNRWHNRVERLEDAKVFQTKSAASRRANIGSTNGPTGGYAPRIFGKAVRVELTIIEVPEQ